MTQLQGKWRAPLYHSNKPKYPRIHIPAMNKDDNLTFSFGRNTTYDEVVSVLCDSGCMDPENYLDQIQAMRINNKKMDNGQVMITCNPGQSNVWVRKLSQFNKVKLIKTSFLL